MRDFTSLKALKRYEQKNGIRLSHYNIKQKNKGGGDDKHGKHLYSD